jgi:MFS family permease
VFLRNATVIGTSSLLPVYLVGQVGVTEAVMGLLLAVNPATQVPIMYVVGGLADRVGRRPLVVLGMAGSGLYALVMAAAVVPGTFAARVALVAIGMVVVAASFSGTRVGAVAYIADVSPPGRESELIGLRSTARGLGGATGPALVGAAALVTSIETAFAAASLLAFAAALLVSRTLVETAPVAVTGSEGGGTDAEAGDAVDPGSR